MSSQLNIKELQRLLDLTDTSSAKWDDIQEKLETQLCDAKIEASQLSVKLTETATMADSIRRKLSELTGE